MKNLLSAFLFLLVSVSLIDATPVTNINAVYRYGQVFVTWDNANASFYVMYKSLSPILHGNQLQNAQYLGKVGYNSSVNEQIQRQLRIDSASQPLASTKGLFVSTTASNGNYYYAVTTIMNNIEDTTIVPNSNSLSLPVTEVMDTPRPVWQFDTLLVSRTFNAYVWFATRVTSANYPKMTSAGTYPLNFAIVKQGSQIPHPVSFWMHGTNGNYIHPNVFGTSHPNEWIITIGDHTPQSCDYHETMYYGYHENYDLFSLSPNLIPDTGTIYNYTSAMVSHTINWALKKLPLDSTRTYMTGFSLGAIGSIFNSLMMPSKIAAIFIYAPVFNLAPFTDPDFERLWGTYQTNLWTNESMRRNERLNVNYLLSAKRLNSLPIIYTFCGKNDLNVGWSEKITFYDSMNVLKHGGFHFWCMGSHSYVFYSNPWKIAQRPPSISFFTQYRTNLSYPAFSSCSHNDDPGNGSPASGDSIGQINGHLDWNDDIVDSTYRWEITLKTKTLVSVYDTLHAPDSCSADVTLRRLQRFNPATGNTIQWTNSKNNVIVQQGTFVYTGGLITIPNVKIYMAANTLKLINVPIGITGNGNTIPLRYELYQNYPNPFNPRTVINFDLPKETLVKLVIYDVLGREITVLVNEKLKAGTYEADFDGTNYTSGVYFYRLTTGDFTDTKKMILIK